MEKVAKRTLPTKWKEAIERVDFAFHPILNILTAETFGVEALLRGYKDAGFESIDAFFDTAFLEGVLYDVDIALRKKVFAKFTQIEGFQNLKLFYNLDNRILTMKNFNNGNTNRILEELGITKDNICFEISERHEASDDTSLRVISQHYKNEGYAVAIDDFGRGYSGYKLLYDLTPEFIKIDRYFLHEIKKDLKKRILVTNITQLAVQLGIKVIAEGIETPDEYLTCKSIGCQYIQGFLVCRPTTQSREIEKKYYHIHSIVMNDKRNRNKNKIEKHLQQIPPISRKKDMKDVIAYLKKNKGFSIIPVINTINEPVGIIKEEEVKEYLYSPYGISLLLNKQSKISKLNYFLKPCPIVDIQSDISSIIKIYSSYPESNGVIVTKNSKFYGFLSEKAIINLVNEENLLMARDQNPLTKLPGNRLIEKYLSSLSSRKYTVIGYLDLDNFKAYNDVYGFRNGDRIIQFFASLLKKNLLPKEYFVAHIGGDDFFVGSHESLDKVLVELKKIMKKFQEDVLSFYNQEDRERGFLIAKDRDGKERKFDFLSFSLSLIEISENSKNRSSSAIASVASEQKRVAKICPNHIALSSML